MKIFIDTANLEEIREANSLGVLDGVTTNPTLLSREAKDPLTQLTQICRIVSGPVSAEVNNIEKAEDIVKEAEELARIAQNIVVKIPVTEEGLRATKILKEKGVKTNLTLCFSPLQALLVAKAGASFVSPFVGRLDDISTEGMNLVFDIKSIYEKYGFKTQIIVASIRHPVHVLEAARTGADIATIPFKVIKQLLLHPLTDIGIKRFSDDWNRLKKTLGK